MKSLKCVTIVAELVLDERLASLLNSCGVAGYATTTGDWDGPGEPQFSLLGRSIVKFEALCEPDVCRVVLEKLAEMYGDQYSCVAWVQDVAVLSLSRNPARSNTKFHDPGVGIAVHTSTSDLPSKHHFGAKHGS